LIKPIKKLTELLPTGSYDKDDLIPPIKKLTELLPTGVNYDKDDLIPPIKKLISNLPEKTLDITYNKEDLLPYITILINRLPILDIANGISYDINEILTPANVLFNIVSRIEGDIDLSKFRCFKQNFNKAIESANKAYITTDSYKYNANIISYIEYNKDYKNLLIENIYYIYNTCLLINK